MKFFAFVIIVLIVLYLLSPIDIIPDVLFPVGYLDDVGVFALGMNAIKNKKYNIKKNDNEGHENNKRYNYRNSFSPVDSERGHWEEGGRGEGIFVPSGNTAVGEKVKYELNRHGLKGIKYTNATPDFGPISEICIRIPNMSSERKGYGNNFDQANDITAQEWNKMAFEGKTNWNGSDVNYWKNANKYTWHEDTDMETMYLVPTEIHDFFKHAGGVSECRKNEKNNNS